MARFDPIMGKSRGWIHKPTNTTNTKMEDAHPEVTTAIQNLPSNNKISPFKASPDEILPIGVERLFSGFLVKIVARSVAIDEEQLRDRMMALRGELLIGKFVGSKPSPMALQAWICSLNQEVRVDKLPFIKIVGNGYFFFEEKTVM